MTLIRKLLTEHRNLVKSPTLFSSRKALFLVGGPESWSLKPEALVETATGLKPLVSIEKGDRVYGMTDAGMKTLTDVQQVVVTEDADERIEIVMDDGQSFVCNGSDKLLLEGSGEWVRVDTLKQGDEVVVK